MTRGSSGSPIKFQKPKWKYMETFCHFGGGKKTILTLNQPKLKVMKIPKFPEIPWSQIDTKLIGRNRVLVSKTFLKDLTFRNVPDVSEKSTILCFFLKSLSYVLPHDLYGIIWVRCFLGIQGELSPKIWEMLPKNIQLPCFILFLRNRFVPPLVKKTSQSYLSSD